MSKRGRTGTVVGALTAGSGFGAFAEFIDPNAPVSQPAAAVIAVAGAAGAAAGTYIVAKSNPSRSGPQPPPRSRRARRR